MKSALPPLKVVSAKDSLLKLNDGREIVDAISSWWVITHGHCQSEISQAIASQSGQIDQVLFANFCHQAGEELVECLARVLPPSLGKMFFSDNGSTAVEVALKMAMQYWQQVGQPQRKTFLSFERAYHGDTVGAMSVSGDSVFSAPYKDMLFDVVKLKQGRFSSDGVDEFTGDFQHALRQYGDTVAAVIVEPLVQGAGGMITWPKEALETIHRLCKNHDILLIFDEVMTGFGRTGSLFAFEQLSFHPDLVCFSKGLTGGALPLALTVTTEKVYQAFLSEDKSKMFFHGHSFTGNPVACAAAVANLKLLASKDYSVQWKRIADIHRQYLDKLSEKDYVVDTRLCGTIGVVELADKTGDYTSNVAERLGAFALERGVFLRPLGNVVYVLPPYCITDGQLHQVWDVIGDGLECVKNQSSRHK